MVHRFSNYLLLFALTLLAACSAAPEITVQRETVIAEIPMTVEVTRQFPVVETVEVTREVEVTRVVEVTKVVERSVTVTPTNTPRNTPTPVNSPTPVNTSTPLPPPTATLPPTSTSTPVPTMPPTATPDVSLTATVQALGELASPKGSGFYTVGTEILPGRWESTDTSNGCYWARLDASQNILNNHFGMAGGTMTIQPTDAQVELDGCGTWVYVENGARPLAADANAPKGDGFFTVGVEIAPGQWESTGTADDCYWARLTDTQDIIDNHFGQSGGVVTVASSDYEIMFEDCGSWEYRGP